MQSPADDDAEPAVPDAPRPSAEATTRSLWRRRRRVVVPLVAVVALAAATVAAAGILYHAVVAPVLGDRTNSSTIYYSDGTVLAHLDRVRTQALRWDQFSNVVGQTAVAAQDPAFWTDEGGALTRRVVRMSMERTPHSMLDRARLWVGARKLDEIQTKQNILEYFLNAVPLGRATFGVEAAAQVYFGKTARRDAGPAEALTVAEAMVLMALLDAPEDYDPVRTPATSANSHRRWTEIRDAMRDQGYLSASAAAALTYPTTARADTPTAWPTAAGPAGLVVPHVVAELAAMPQFAHLTYGQLATAGLKIISTVSSPAQQLLERVADGPTAGSVMSGQPAALAAAAVVVEPRTGRVLAYYGGAAGNGADYAGTYVDDTGARVGFGAHPAGGMFGVHVLAAGLQAGMSVQSKWSPAVVDLPGRTGGNAVRNTSVCASPCTLATATTVGFNTTMYQVTLSAGPDKVLEAARDAGIGALYTADHRRVELAPGPLASLVPGTFNAEVALGPYAVTVADEAVAMAGYAGLGNAVTGHFVLKVLRDDRVLATETVPVPGPPFLDTGRANDLTWVLSQSPAAKLDSGWPSALKTGSYPAESADAPTDAWAVGYTTTLAVAVWVGNRATVAPLRDREGKAVFGSGLPAQIYRAFLNAAPDALHLPSPPAPFPAPAFVGDAFPPGSQR